MPPLAGLPWGRPGAALTRRGPLLSATSWTPLPTRREKLLFRNWFQRITGALDIYVVLCRLKLIILVLFWLLFHISTWCEACLWAVVRVKCSFTRWRLASQARWCHRHAVPAARARATAPALSREGLLYQQHHLFSYSYLCLWYLLFYTTCVKASRINQWLCQ